MTQSFTAPLKSHAYYLRHGFDRRTTQLIKYAKEELTGIDFDTIVCTGLSGMLVAPILWRAMDVPYFAVVRKPEDQDNHSERTVEGHIGARWLFVDDLVATGTTRRRVRDAIEAFAGTRHKTKFVGTYEYRHTKFWGPFWGPFSSGGSE